MEKINRYIDYSSILIIIFILLFTIISFFKMYYIGNDRDKLGIVLKDGWYNVSDTEKEEISLPYKQDSTEGINEFSYTVKMPQIRENYHELYIEAGYCDVEIFIDQKKIYSEVYTDTIFSTTNGVRNFFVNMPPDWQGKKLTIVYKPQVIIDSYKIYPPIICEQEDMQKFIYHNSQSLLIMLVMIIITGIIMIICSFILNLYFKYNYLLCYFAFFIIISAVNIGSKMEWARVMATDPVVLYTIEHFSLLIITIPILIAIRNSLVKKGKNLVSILLVFAVLNSLIQAFLYFLTDTALVQMVKFSHFQIILCILLTIYLLIFTDFKDIKQKKEIIISLLPVCVTVVINIILYYYLEFKNDFNYLVIGVMIMVIFQAALLIYRAKKALQEQQEQKIYKKLAFIETLTQTKNRNSYEEDFEMINTMLHENSKKNIACVVVDINDLKGVNDKYGHSVGDEMVKRMAEYLKEYFPDCLGVYRLGGDEFVVIVEENRKEVIENIISEIKKKTDRTPFIKDKKISFSYGFTIFDSERHRDFSDMFKEADIRMYNNKRSFYETEGDRRNNQ